MHSVRFGLAWLGFVVGSNIVADLEFMILMLQTLKFWVTGIYLLCPEGYTYLDHPMPESRIPKHPLQSEFPQHLDHLCMWLYCLYP